MSLTAKQERFKTKVFNLVGTEYTVIGKYINAKTKLAIKHEKCGYQYDTTPDNFTNRKRRCPKCSLVIRGKKRRKSNKTFQKEVFELVGNEYDLLSEYKLSTEKIKIRHNVCGHEYFVLPPDFVSGGRRCPECAWGSRAEKRKKSVKVLKKEVYDLYGGEYEVTGTYTGYREKLEFKHITCGHRFKVLTSNFLGGHSGCPKCSSSKGESEIAKVLEDKNVDFIRQYRIKECRNIRPLPFDFAIFKKGSLHMLIEFDGEFHFKRKFGHEQFKRVQLNDSIKTDFCKKNGIPLIRIPYTEFHNIENILNEAI